MRQCNIITLPQPSHANILLACHIFLIIECLSICKSQSLHFYDITLSHKQIRSTQTPHLFQLNMTKHVHIDKINCEQVPFSSKTVGKMQTSETVIVTVLPLVAQVLEDERKVSLSFCLSPDTHATSSSQRHRLQVTLSQARPFTYLFCIQYGFSRKSETVCSL